MKALIVLNSAGFFRHFDTVVAGLCERGHDVTVMTRLSRKADFEDDYRNAIEATVASHATGSYDMGMLKRRDRWNPVVHQLRRSLDYALYFRPEHNSPALAERLGVHVWPGVRRMIESPRGRRMVAEDRFWDRARRLQARIPADRKIAAQLRDLQPDVVLGCPFVYTMGPDIEYLRAAKQAGMVTIGSVGSWDNLTTKGAIHLETDRVFVWNEALADEAHELHGTPRERIDVTGAAKFDAYFDMQPRATREEFCARLGLDPARPYVLYVGSSQQIAGDETGFVREAFTALSTTEGTRDLQMVVRPHPLNADVWDDFEHQDMAVFPRGGERPDVEGPRQDYFDTMAHSAAIAGVNTTAFLEAAVADRPCLSIVSERHRTGQAQRGHFQHLVRGGFIETVPDPAAAAAALGRIAAGEDPRREQRREFVARFVRPGGIGRPAGDVVADAIERAVAGRVTVPAASAHDDGVPAAAAAAALARAQD